MKFKKHIESKEKLGKQELENIWKQRRKKNHEEYQRGEIIAFLVDRYGKRVLGKDLNSFVTTLQKEMSKKIDMKDLIQYLDSCFSNHNAVPVVNPPNGTLS